MKSSVNMMGLFLEKRVIELVRWYFGPRVVIALAATLVLISGATGVANAMEKRRLTVRDAIETTRFLTDFVERRSLVVSPDQSRYVAMLVRGDVGRDGVEVEIISGRLTSMEAAKPYSVARLFTRGLGATMLGEGGEAPNLLLTPVSFPVWIDNERVALLWDDDNGVRQVLAANTETKEWRFLTTSPTDVTSFGIGPTGTLVYEARKPLSLEKSDDRWRTGFTMPTPEAWSLLQGVVDGSSARDIAWGVGEKFVQLGLEPGATVKKITVAGGVDSIYDLSWPAVRPNVSPDGSLAIVSGTPELVPENWISYEGDYLQAFVRGWKDRRASNARQLQQMFVVSIDDAASRPVWNAPMNVRGAASIRWEPESRSVLAWPVYLPLESQNQAGTAGQAIAEIDVRTGAYAALPVPAADLNRIEDVVWKEKGEIEVQLPGESIQFGKRSGSWIEIGRRVRPASEVTRIRVELRQDPSTPPALYAVDELSGRDELIYDPNQRLKDFSLGEVRFSKWRDADRHEHEGRLFLPVGYRSDRRYPLVIQLRGWGSREDFTLYGSGGPRPTLGPTYSAYLAQPLANQGIAVLQLGPPPAEDPAPEAMGWMRSIESAIDYLDSIKIVDRNHVGIIGHSRAAWHVQYALAFSEYRIAAAVADDGIDSGYFEAVMAGWADVERRNGAEPFGKGLKDWLEKAPAFNVERIRSPLLLTVTDSFAGRATPLARWEMFSRLRHLRKPVELWVVPRIERGSHNLQNPGQLIAHQERVLDWWKYWLQDERDTSVGKLQQYTYWDELRRLRDEDSLQPRPPRLRWSAIAEEMYGHDACLKGD